MSYIFSDMFDCYKEPHPTEHYFYDATEPCKNPAQWRFLTQEELDFYTKGINDYVEEQMSEWRSNWQQPIVELANNIDKELINYMQVIGDYPTSSWSSFEYTPHIGDLQPITDFKIKINDNYSTCWPPIVVPRFNGYHNNIQYLERESIDHLIFDFSMPGYEKKEISVIAKGNNIRIKAYKTKTTDNFKTIGGALYLPTYDFNFNVADKYDATKAVVKYENGILYVDIPMNKKFKEEKEIKLL